MNLIFTLAAISKQVAGSYAPGELLLKFKKDNELMSAFYSASLGRIAGALSEIGVEHVQLTDESRLKQLHLSLQSLPEIEYVELNYERLRAGGGLREKKSGAEKLIKRASQEIKYLDQHKNVNLKQQWFLHQIKALGGWGLLAPKENIKVAVLDSGVELLHPSLKSKIANSYDTITGSQNMVDQDGHGTHCAGIIGATKEGQQGIYGIAENSTIIPIRVLIGNKGFVSWIARGILHAIKSGAKVISMSFSSENPSKVEKDAIDFALSNGIVLVAAAGNEGKMEKRWPAAYKGVISVGATEQDDSKGAFSNFGPWVDVAAPGREIYSTLPIKQGIYGKMDGTSMACPQVSGLAALILTVKPNAAPSEVKELIVKNSDSVGDWLKYGRINIHRSLEQAIHQNQPNRIVPVDQVRVSKGTIEKDSLSASDQLSPFSYKSYKSFKMRSKQTHLNKEEANYLLDFTLLGEQLDQEKLTLQFHIVTTKNLKGTVSALNQKTSRYEKLGEFEAHRSDKNGTVITVPFDRKKLFLAKDGEINFLINTQRHSKSSKKLAKPFHLSVEMARLVLAPS